jgi:hypothetical protein
LRRKRTQTKVDFAYFLRVGVRLLFCRFVVCYFVVVVVVVVVEKKEEAKEEGSSST